MNSVLRARAIVANRATTLCCTPTYAVRLGEVARDEGIDLAAVLKEAARQAKSKAAG